MYFCAQMYYVFIIFLRNAFLTFFILGELGSMFSTSMFLFKFACMLVMCVLCVHECSHICKQIFMCLYMHAFCVYAGMYLCVCKPMHVHACIVFVYVCLFVCVCIICVYMYVHG